MKAKEGKDFIVGKEYKITYYQRLVLKDFRYTAACVRINDDRTQAVFRIGAKEVDYFIERVTSPMEKDGEIYLVRQEIATVCAAQYNPTAASYRKDSVIYAENEMVGRFGPEEDLITLKDYAATHSVSPATVRQKILRGNLPAVKMGRDWLINKDEPYADKRKKDID